MIKKRLFKTNTKTDVKGGWRKKVDSAEETGESNAISIHKIMHINV